MLLKIYKKLLNHFGYQNWWPVTSNNKTDEIIIGAILTQNTAWKNVEKVIKILKDKNLLNKKAMLKILQNELANLIKPVGYYNQKAKKLKAFFNYNGEITRENLLSIWGIGEETADSILLYAYEKPYFIVDAYTKRVMKHLGFDESSYKELQNLFHKNLPEDVEIYKEFHALFVELGKKYCRTKPVCDKCPLIEVCKCRE